MQNSEEFTRVTRRDQIQRLVSARAFISTLDGRINHKFCIEKKWSISSTSRPITPAHAARISHIMQSRSLLHLYLCPVGNPTGHDFYSITSTQEDLSHFSLASYENWLAVPEDVSFALAYGEDDHWDIAGPAEIVEGIVGDTAKAREDFEWNIAHMSPPAYAERSQKRALMNRHVCKMAAAEDIRSP